MKTTKLFYTAIILLLISSSCQKKISFDAELISSRLVVNGLIEPDSVVDILIATSKPIPGVVTDFNWITDAEVVLYEDGVKKETLETYDIVYDDTNNLNNWYSDTAEKRPEKGYRSKLKVKAGKTYKLEVTHKDYDAVQCETYVPKVIPIESLDTSTYTSIEHGYEQKIMHLKLTFKDPADEDNYYRLIAYYTHGEPAIERYSENEADTIIYVSEDYLRINDPIINPEQEDANDILFSNPPNIYQVFTDELIQGKEYTINSDLSLFNVYYPELIGQIDSLGGFYRLKIILQSLSREAYLYLKTSYEHQYYNGELFVEPVQVFSNVEGGIGIFGAQASSILKFNKGEYPIDGLEYREGYNNYYYYY